MFIVEGVPECKFWKSFTWATFIPASAAPKKDSQYSGALNEVVKAGNALLNTLTGKQKEQFEAYMTAQREVNILTDCETFIYAFRLDAKIMMDVLIEGKMKEI